MLRFFERQFIYYNQNHKYKLTPKQRRRLNKKRNHWAARDQSRYVSD
jgi:hypothetical protein